MSAAIRPQPPPATSSSSKQLSVHLTKSFEFVTHNSPGKPDRDGQRLIRSHASRGKRNKKHAGLLDRSWILQRNGSLAAVDAQYTSIPSRVGSDLSFFTFPVELQPYMQDDIARGISLLTYTGPPFPLVPAEGFCQEKHQAWLTPNYLPTSNWPYEECFVPARDMHASRPCPQLMDRLSVGRFAVSALHDILGRSVPRRKSGKRNEPSDAIPFPQDIALAAG